MTGKITQYYQEVALPVRIIENDCSARETCQDAIDLRGFDLWLPLKRRFNLKTFCSAVLILSVIISQTMIYSAFEAHIINVTAKISDDLPQISPPGGEFCNQTGAILTLSVDLQDADILYTTDGSDPVCPDQGILYAAPFTLNSSATVKARSCHDEKQSQIVSWYFDISASHCPSSCLKINEVFYKPCPCGDCPCGNTEILIENSASVSNNINASSNTGGNNSSGRGAREEGNNERGGIRTGNATSEISVINIINANSVEIDNCPCQDQCQDQWLELYNSCETSVNLKDWYLENNGGSQDRETIHQNYVIEPGQFVVLAANASLWQQCWDIVPENAVKIALGGQGIFDGLQSAGDRLFLYNASGTQIDEVSWGTDISAFDPAVPETACGSSIARISAGFDTNAASDWEELTSPTPGTSTNSESVVFQPVAAEPAEEQPALEETIPPENSAAELMPEETSTNTNEIETEEKSQTEQIFMNAPDVPVQTLSPEMEEMEEMETSTEIIIVPEESATDTTNTAEPFATTTETSAAESEAVIPAPEESAALPEEQSAGGLPEKTENEPVVVPTETTVPPA